MSTQTKPPVGPMCKMCAALSVNQQMHPIGYMNGVLLSWCPNCDANPTVPSKHKRGAA